MGERSMVDQRERALARSAFFRRVHGGGSESGLRTPRDSRRRTLAVWLSVLAAAIGLYLSGSRSTLFLVFAVLMGLGIRCVAQVARVAARAFH